LRVVYFAEIFPSQSETWVHHEINELTRNGCEVHVFATWEKPEIKTPEAAELASKTIYPRRRGLFGTLRGFLAVCRPHFLARLFTEVVRDPPTVRNAGQILRDVKNIAKFIRPIRGISPDVCICHFAGTRATLGMMLHWLDGTPFIVETHALDVFRTSALFAAKVREASLFFTISKYNLGFIEEHYPSVRVDLIKLHGCGIPLGVHAFEPAEKTDGGAIPILVSVGRLVVMKGFDFLIRASRILRDQGVEHRIRIIGDGPERETLAALIGELGVEDSVELMGYQPPAGVRAALKVASAVVMPCIWDRVGASQDGIPVALMEAMASGTPVVSTYLSGIPELIEDGVSGFLAQPEDTEGLADAINRSLNLAAPERLRMLEYARDEIERNHDIVKLTKSLLAEIRTVIPTGR